MRKRKIRNSNIEIRNKFQIPNSKFQVLALVLILLLAGFFRLYRLNSVPPSPSLDEVSIGWNAYSLSETGQDEYGYRWPILLRAYDDWRPALYLYFVIPFVKLLGLSATAVRLPSVLLSLITVLTTYFLARELFKDSLLINDYSLLITFLLSISPWHIYLSRLGHEVNAGLAFSVLAIFLFLKSINKDTSEVAEGTPRRWMDTGLALSAVFFALSFYTYQSQKLFLPLMIISLGLIFSKKLLKRKKEVVLAALLGLILLVPILKSSLSPGALMRFQGASIFSAQEEVNQRAALRVLRDYQQNNILGLIFDNRRVAVGLRVLQSYLSHFGPGWLFFNGGEEKHKIPGLGLFYLWELPLLLIGAYQLIRNKFPREMKRLVFSWLLLAPLPATITSEAPHAMRVFNILPMPQILVALGIAAAGLKLKAKMSKLKLKTQKNFNFLLPASCFLFLVFNILFLYHNYFTNFPHEQSGSFQYALSRVIPDVLSVKDNYQKIVFSNEEYCRQSYMFLLFFSQYDPFDYLEQGGTASGGFAEAHFFDKYEFRPIDWKKEKKETGVLYVGNANDFGQKVLVLKTFENLDGQAVVRMVEPLIIID